MSAAYITLTSNKDSKMLFRYPESAGKSFRPLSAVSFFSACLSDEGASFLRCIRDISRKGIQTVFIFCSSSVSKKLKKAALPLLIKKAKQAFPELDFQYPAVVLTPTAQKKERHE